MGSRRPRNGARRRHGRTSATHMAVMSGMDFFMAEVLTGRGPATHYVLFVIPLETRRVTLAGITRHPTEEWMQQVARNLTDAEAGDLQGQRHVLHDATRSSATVSGPCFAPEAWNRCGSRRVLPI